MITRRTIIALVVVLACAADRTPNGSPGSSAGAQSRVALSDTGDGCTQVRGPRPDSTLRLEDTAAIHAWEHALGHGGTQYRCIIDSGHIAMRVWVLFDTLAGGIDSIIVARDSSFTPTQVIGVVESETPSPWNGAVIRAIDIDGDGYRDLFIGKAWGATGNTLYDIQRFEPSSNRFIGEDDLEGVSNPKPILGQPCYATSSNTSALDHTMAVLCRRDGKWIVDSTEAHRWDRATHTVTYEVRARRGDSMIVVRRETTPDSK
jgi:hypothetical protein